MQDSITPEALEASDTRHALEEAFWTIYPTPPAGYHDEPWRNRAIRFRRFLDAEAWTDAALLLVPEGFDWSMDNFDGELGKPSAWICNKGPFFNGTADHPALALAQACLKARENGDG